jgi:hypothetical protein
MFVDRLCVLVVRVPGYRSGGPGSIPGATQPHEYNLGATWKKKYRLRSRNPRTRPWGSVVLTT